MPKVEGVYRPGNGSWYFKATVGRDPLTGKRIQVTKRGFPTAKDAARARRKLLEDVDEGVASVAAGSLTVNELLDLYLDGIDANRRNADSYVRPWLSRRRVRGSHARAPARVAAGALPTRDEERQTAGRQLDPVGAGFARRLDEARREPRLLRANPLTSVPRPQAQRSVPRHWNPDEARLFLRTQEADRLYPLWAFLLGSGVRIGELVWLRWPNVDLEARCVRIVDFATTLGWDLVASAGKSATAVRTIDLDDGLVRILRRQQQAQRFEARADLYLASEFLFTRTHGGSFHPQLLSKLLADRAVAAGLPRLTAHGIRHTSATLMLEQGVAPKVAAERLGHADPSLFINLYSHVTPTMQRGAADAIGAALFANES